MDTFQQLLAALEDVRPVLYSIAVLVGTEAVRFFVRAVLEKIFSGKGKK